MDGVNAYWSWVSVDELGITCWYPGTGAGGMWKRVGRRPISRRFIYRWVPENRRKLPLPDRG